MDLGIRIGVFDSGVGGLTVLKSLQQTIDTLVLGCTHYILIRALFSKRFKNLITLLDANEAVARRAFNLVTPIKQVQQMVECYTSGSTQLLKRIIDHLEINAVTKIERLQL